jgi:hypothetical protein
MKFRTVFALAILWLMLTMLAFAWDWGAILKPTHEKSSVLPSSFQPVYQKPPVKYSQNDQNFSLANLATISKKDNIRKDNSSLQLLHLPHLSGEVKVMKIAPDVPFVFNDNLTSIADYSPYQIRKISTSSIELNGVPMNSSPDIWGGHQKEFDAKIEPDHLIVREEVVMLNESSTGNPNISQICSIYKRYRYGDNTTKGWNYINDPRGLNWAYANESLQIGRKVGYVAAGDCDDFAIVISALVESIGGSSRIVWGINPKESHAFAEVYLGEDVQNSNVENIIKWLMNKFDTDKIYTHVDTNRKDVWLNLDWSATHPGGPFYKADKYVIYSNRDSIAKEPLEL